MNIPSLIHSASTVYFPHHLHGGNGYSHKFPLTITVIHSASTVYFPHHLHGGNGYSHKFPLTITVIQYNNNDLLIIEAVLGYFITTAALALAYQGGR